MADLVTIPRAEITKKMGAWASQNLSLHYNDFYSCCLDDIGGLKHAHVPRSPPPPTLAC